MVHLDDCTFHECIKLDEFSDAKILTVRPPEGEVGMQNMLGHFRKVMFSVVSVILFRGWGPLCIQDLGPGPPLYKAPPPTCSNNSTWTSLYKGH